MGYETLPSINLLFISLGVEDTKLVKVKQQYESWVTVRGSRMTGITPFVQPMGFAYPVMLLLWTAYVRHCGGYRDDRKEMLAL